MSDLYSIAIHEAAHAVIGRCLGLPCGNARIAGSDDGLGYAHVESPERTWERGDGPKTKWADAFCIALYAGGEAEKWITGSQEVGDSEDVERAISCLSWCGVRGAQFVGDEAYDRKEASLRKIASGKVMMNRSDIERVAAALVEKTPLEAGEIDKLINPRIHA